MEQILFLDIDGVLNSKSTQTYYSVDHPEKYSINETCWNNLEKILLKVPNVQVVIHSGWIKYQDDPNYRWDMGHPEKGVSVKTLLPKVKEKLGKRFIGFVNYIKGKPKSFRIEKWLREHNALDNSNFSVVVLDDDRSEYTSLEKLNKFGNVHVIFTDTDVGLTEEIAKQAIGFLG